MIEFIGGTLVGLIVAIMPLAAGIILLLAGSTWFTGAVTVGWILIGMSIVLALFVGLVMWAANIT